MKFYRWRNRFFLLFERVPFFIRLVFFWPLLPVHWGWKGVSFFRHIFYEKGVFYAVSIKKPVVCVGNILCGGTGKTPFVLFLIEELIKRGLKVAVLSRGYKSLFEKEEAKLVCKGEGPLYSSEEMGDEAYLVCAKFPSILYYVGKNRVKAAHFAEKEVDIIVLEDGLQYRKLKPSFQIILEPKASFFSGEYWEQKFFLPIGRLRDLPSRKKQADLIVGKGQVGGNTLSVSYEIESFFSLKEKQEVFLPDRSKVALFCGIAKPNRFVQEIKRKGLFVIDTQFLADHASFSEEKLMLFAEKSKNKGAKMLICTEKDSVKLILRKELPIPVSIAKLSLKIDSEKSKWNLFIEKIVSCANNCGD